MWLTWGCLAGSYWFCPEITPENAEKFLSRLQERIDESLGVQLRYGVAAFPEDAPSFKGVLDVAVSRLE